MPIFKKQIENGGPLTITDPEMTRFVMSIPEAVDMILQAGEIAEGKEIFILKMPALYIVDLAEVMIELLAHKYGFSQDEIEIEYIGKRLGEKMFEELMTEEELSYVEDKGELFILNSEYHINENSNFDYNSHLTRKLNKDEIREILLELL